MRVRSERYCGVRQFHVEFEAACASWFINDELRRRATGRRPRTGKVTRPTQRPRDTLWIQQQLQAPGRNGERGGRGTESDATAE